MVYLLFRTKFDIYVLITNMKVCLLF